ncbi:MAG: DUF4232 domain-containing protein [Actinomycetota bacterium]|nr:DUF4232 domain-containing protein [Actinomycetota bacterium]
MDELHRRLDAMTSDGTPRGAETVWRDARAMLQRRRSRRRFALGGVSVAVALVIGAIAVAWGTNDHDRRPAVAVVPPATGTDTLGDRALPTNGLVLLDDHAYDRASRSNSYSVTLATDTGSVLARLPRQTLGNDVTNSPWSVNLVVTDSDVRIEHAPIMRSDGDGCAPLSGRPALEVAVCGPRSLDQLLGSSVAVRRGDKWDVVIEAPPVPAGTMNGGHWEWAAPSPDGRWLLAQWSGACESQHAFLISIADHSVYAVTGEVGTAWVAAAESGTLGWTAKGQAIITLGPGCDTAAKDAPGVYMMSPADRSRRLLRRLPADGPVLHWTSVDDQRSHPSTAQTGARSAPCRTAQLQLAVARDLGSLMAQAAAFLGLTNRSGTPCAVEGYPTMSLYDSNGAQMPMRFVHGDMYQINDPGVHAVRIEPGHSVYFGLGWLPYRFNPSKGSDGYLGCVRLGRVKATLADGDVSVSSPAGVRLPFCPPWGATVTSVAPAKAFTIASPLGPSLGG